MDAESSPSPKKKKGKGKLILLVVLVLLLAGGGGAGFAFFKKIGPFAAKAAPPAPEKPKVAAKPIPKPPAPATTVVRTIPPTTKVDPDEGAAKLAKLWNEIEAPQLLAIAKDWREPELARVTAKMDPGKVAELLSAMPPKRASSLSREMQKIASIVPIDD